MGMDVQRISDILEIQALLTDYVFALDTRELDRLDDVFMPDAVCDYRATGGRKGDWSEIKPWLVSALNSFGLSQHLIGMPQIRFDQANADRATSMTMLFNPMHMLPEQGGQTFFIGATYSDELVRTAAGWRIASRTEIAPWSKDVPASVPQGSQS